MNPTDQEIIRSATVAVEKILSGGIPAVDLNDQLTDNHSSEIRDFVKSFQLMVNQYMEGYRFILGLSKGMLNQPPPKNNQFVSSFKQLHSDLLHLTWQTQQIANGDYSQQVTFMGDFSIAFNKLIDSLRKKQVLEDELKEREQHLLEKSEELTANNEMKDKLFSIIAHDLRGPIGNTGNLVRLLLDDDITDPEEVKKILKMVYASSESIYLLLENLLAWSDSRRREIPYNPIQNDLVPIFKETIDLYSAALRLKNIENEIITEKRVDAYFDTAMIQTVLRNLFSNALKFTPAGGRITLGARKHDNKILVSVKDTGIGMSPAILESLFANGTDKVRQGTNKEKGHGLGLILCKEMIIRHGDDLRVSSAVGEGTTFTFRLADQAPAN